MSQNKTALVLEGGGMRGTYTTGVLDWMMDQGLVFDGCYGVSAGVCHACSFLSNQRNRACRVVVDYIDDKRYLNFRQWLKTGDGFGWDLIMDEIPNKLDPFDYEAFRNKKTKLFGVVTNCETGQPEYLEIKDLATQIDVITASSSLPMISNIVTINGKPYLDGGVSDSIPVEKALADGYEKVVVVLTRDGSYRKKPAKTFYLKGKYKQYPKLIEALQNRYITYNKALDRIDALEREGKLLVIRPSRPLEVGRLERNREKLLSIYRIGYHDCEAMEEKIKQYLEI